MAEFAINAHIGRRIAARRKILGLSVAVLAEALSIEPKRMLDYEAGRERLSAQDLHTLSKLLQVPVGYFFDGLDEAP